MFYAEPHQIGTLIKNSVEMFYLNTIDLSFLFVEQLDQLGS